MNLSAMTLDDMGDLNVTTLQLIAAGRLLDDAGFAPVFDLLAPGGVTIYTKWIFPRDTLAKVPGFEAQPYTPGPRQAKAEIPVVLPARRPIVEGPFTKAERARVAELAAEGRDARAIAAELNRRVAPIAMMLKPPASQAYKTKPRPRTTNVGQPWTAEDDDYAVTMRAAGKTPREIAIGLHRPIEAVRQRLKRHLVDRVTAARAAEPDAAPLPKSPWTPAEDAAFVEAAAQAIARTGCTRNAAAAEAGVALGRPVPGSQYRAKHVLRDRIEARVEELLGGVVLQAIPAGPPATDPVRTDPVSEGPKDAEGVRPEPVEASEPAVAGAGSSPYTVAVVPPQLPLGPKPVPAPAVERVLPAPAPEVPFDPSTPLWQRELRALLASLGNPGPFTPAFDLELVERLQLGESLGLIAADTGIDAIVLKKRYIALLPVTGIEAQARLLAELRRRAAEVAA